MEWSGCLPKIGRRELQPYQVLTNHVPSHWDVEPKAVDPYTMLVDGGAPKLLFTLCGVHPGGALAGSRLPVSRTQPKALAIDDQVAKEGHGLIIVMDWEGCCKRAA